jgi:osmotically-inducible protein OsmY
MSPATATLSRPLFDRICDALTTNPHVPSEKVRVEAADGRVVLKGSVSTFFQKQMAQEAVRRIDGVQQIENLLQVNWA